MPAPLPNPRISITVFLFPREEVFLPAQITPAIAAISVAAVRLFLVLQLLLAMVMMRDLRFVDLL